MSRSPMINQMKTHQDRAILKAKLMAEDPRCSICQKELRSQYGHDNSGIVADGVLKCPGCVEGKPIADAEWNLPPCCEQCGTDIPANRVVKSCDDCRRKKYSRRKSIRSAELMAKGVEHIDGVMIYDLPDDVTSAELLEGLGLSRCPLCGCEIDADSIGCWKHTTTLLMRKLKASERFSG